MIVVVMATAEASAKVLICPQLLGPSLVQQQRGDGDDDLMHSANVRLIQTCWRRKH